MPERKAKWGVRVTRDGKWSSATRGKEAMDYTLHLAKKAPGTRGFFTHPELHSAIKKLIKEKKLIKNEKLGYAVIDANRDRKRVEIPAFYPYGLPESERGIDLKEMRGHGAATFFRKQIVKGLIKQNQFYEYKIKSRTDLAKEPTDEVVEHLRKRGIGTEREYNLNEYLELLESHEVLQEAKLGYTSREFKEKEMTNIHSAIQQFEEKFGKGQVLAAYLVGGAKKAALGYRTHKKGYKDIDVFLVTKDNFHSLYPGIWKVSDKLNNELNIDLGFLHVERITGDKFPDHDEFGQLASHDAIITGIPIYNKKLGRELQKKAAKQMREELGDNYDKIMEKVKRHVKKKVQTIW